jgi:hypothetical protein
MGNVRSAGGVYNAPMPSPRLQQIISASSGPEDIQSVLAIQSIRAGKIISFVSYPLRLQTWAATKL